MKKTGCFLFAVLLLSLTWLPTAATAASFSLPLRVEYQGERIYFPDEQPFIDKAQRVLVPVRFVSEALGANVKWTGATKTVTIKQDSNAITLVLGNKSYIVNGENKQMDTSDKSVGGRTFVPLRFVSEGLGAYVKWDSAVKTVYISMTPFDPADEKKEENEKVVEEDMYGFKVKLNTGSGLDVEKVEEEYVKKGHYALLIILISFPDQWAGVDYQKQIQEVEDIIYQKIEKETADDIMEYVRKKKTSVPELPKKIFEDENYKVEIQSRWNSSLVLNILNK